VPNRRRRQFGGHVDTDLPQEPGCHRPAAPQFALQVWRAVLDAQGAGAVVRGTATPERRWGGVEHGRASEDAAPAGVAQQESIADLILTPDKKGKYETGSWSKDSAAMPSGYAPYAFASQILPDGRLIVNGGEYNGNCTTKAWTTRGALYDPVTDSWASVSPNALTAASRYWAIPFKPWIIRVAPEVNCV